MKRFAFWFAAALVAISVVRSNHRHDRDHATPRVMVIQDHDGQVTRTILSSSSEDIDDDFREAADDAREAVENARKAAREAVENARKATEQAREAERKAVEESRGNAREFVEGIPVPVVPGTRVTVARPEPPAPPKAPKAPKAPRKPRTPVRPKVEVKIDPITVEGRLSATEDRAKADGRRALIETIRQKLDGRVPPSWPIPDRVVDAMIKDVKVDEVQKEYGTMYVAKLSVDASPRRFSEIASRYRSEVRLEKMAMIGGGLLFLLVGLGTISGYIRADEATKGYYTKRLRLAATAGIAATGFALYRALA